MSEKSLSLETWNNNVKRLEEIYGNKNCFSKFNKVLLSGIIEEEFEYSHEVFGEKFYKNRVIVTRLSGTEDYVPIIVPDFLMTNILERTLKGKCVEVKGQLRSYNKMGEDGRRHLYLYLFVMGINVYESEEEVTNANLVYLDGYICKPPKFRTISWEGKITDLMVAVNRGYGKSSYIPCIAWGRVAQYASKLEVGNRIQLYGRVQSRQYCKRFWPESEAREITTYEISIMEMMKAENI